MSKVLDLTNQRFGKLTAIRVVGSDKNYNKIWECKCDCGNTCTALAKALKNGHTRSCGCSRTIDRATDLTGQKFGRLTVVERDWGVASKKGAFWKCLCSCGNQKTVSGAALKSGATQSCGCLNKDINSQPKQINRMIGKRFGRLTVLDRAGTHVSAGGQKKPLWLCRCDCGNEATVTSQDLKSGHTKSCGCLPTKQKGDRLIDLAGRRFGKLVVLERADDYIYTRRDGMVMHTPRWECRCDCGNIVTVQGGNLRNGNTTNCGCENIKSKGEEIVDSYLTEQNIKHLREYSFDDLRSQRGNPLRFDFAILDEQDVVVMLIEFQGEQHYTDCGTFGWYQRAYSDSAKKDYCKSHKIPLYEIKHDADMDSVLPNMLHEINKL